MKKLLGYSAILLMCLGIIFAVNPANAMEVTLMWDANTESNLAGYKIYYDTDGSGDPYDGTGAIEGDSPINVSNVTEFTLRGLTNDVTYVFAVTAYNTDEPPLESGYSNEVSNRHSFALSVIGSGNITVVPEGGIYDVGTELTLTAVPATSWRFTGWSGDIGGADNPHVIVVEVDTSITATFVEISIDTLTAPINIKVTNP